MLITRVCPHIQPNYSFPLFCYYFILMMFDELVIMILLYHNRIELNPIFMIFGDRILIFGIGLLLLLPQEIKTPLFSVCFIPRNNITMSRVI